MSLVNLTLRVSHFNININIKRVELNQAKCTEAEYCREQRLQEALNIRDQAVAKYHELNGYRLL